MSWRGTNLPRSDRPKRRTVALRASVGSTEVTVCPHTWTLTTPCARASRRDAEPKNFPIGIAHPWSWAIGSSTSAAQRSFDNIDHQLLLSILREKVHDNRFL